MYNADLLLLGFKKNNFRDGPPMLGIPMISHPPWCSLKFCGCLHMSPKRASLLSRRHVTKMVEHCRIHFELVFVVASMIWHFHKGMTMNILMLFVWKGRLGEVFYHNYTLLWLVVNSFKIKLLNKSNSFVYSMCKIGFF